MVWPTAVTLAAAVPVALLIDHLLGEPPARWHPVVWMGHALGWAGKRVAPLAGQAPEGRDLKSFWLSALVWLALFAITGWIALVLQWALLQLPGWWAAVGLGLCLKPLLAWRMLRSEVLAVEAALGQSLGAGRERLSWLVSRDVSALTESQVRESAIESLAENLNDSLVAPLFWFAVAGLPGAAMYRLANTADAMWGYRT
ncbi:MAG: CobD/CbiB family cobalamin biosynthesis protein, partial [Burkholderiaceae bacterium]|nr:CobD/CbiB family cobalamin biosynthesis protein [Burkholderiaceae bacterium]